MSSFSFLHLSIVFAVVTIVARIWETSLEKNQRLAVENPMEQSPSSEANWFSASQAIPHILWNQTVHHHIDKCLPPVSILNQLGCGKAH
jgi:hypothetical protein